MVWSGPDADAFDSVRSGFDRVNTLANSIGFEVIFPAVTVRTPSGVYSELDFIRLVSWLYAHWHEVGKSSVGILSQALDAFSPEAAELVTEHLAVVASHRTNLHHDLGHETGRVSGTRQRCQAWFETASGVPEPADQTGWQAAFIALADGARLALEAIETTLRRLSADPGVPDWVARMKTARERQLDDGEVDRRVVHLAQLMGVGPLRAPEFRKRFRMGWQQQVRLCPVTEISSILDRAIASDLLQHGANQHPLIPAEVISHLNLAEGPLVGAAMKLAKDLHTSSPCTKAELLQRLSTAWATRGTS